MDDGTLGDLFIFDLAGGVWNYTFGVRTLADDITPDWASSGLNAGNFNFNRFSDVLYLDSDFQISGGEDWRPIMFGTFADRYIGTALAEVVSFSNGPTTASRGGWGGDDSASPNAAHPWFLRGGQSNDAAGAGVFSFNRHSGGSNTLIGFRPIIAGS